MFKLLFVLVSISRSFVSSFDSYQGFNEMVNDSIALSDLRQYESIQQDIFNLIFSSMQETAEVSIFGSRVMNLATKDSDLDLFVDFGRSSRQCLVGISQDLLLLKVLIEESPHWKVENCYSSAAVPVLKAVYLPLNQKCMAAKFYDNSLSICFSGDIIASDESTISYCRMLGSMFRMQPQSISFYHFIRTWLIDYGIHFKGFTVKMLVMFFLQSRNLMPSIEKFQEGKK